MVDRIRAGKTIIFREFSVIYWDIKPIQSVVLTDKECEIWGRKGRYLKNYMTNSNSLKFIDSDRFS